MNQFYYYAFRQVQFNDFDFIKRISVTLDLHFFKGHMGSVDISIFQKAFSV
jgi:hypothetical protein